MSDGLNRVQLLGNLCGPGELRFTQGGQAVLALRLATNESYMDKDKVRQERVEFHALVVWGKRGEGLAKILHKGDRIFIEGGLRSTSYDDKDGIARHKTEIHCSNVILCGGKRTSDGGGGIDNDRQDGVGSGQPDSGHNAARPNGGTSRGGQSAGDFEVAFGRDKGRRISEVGDLSWLRGTLERDLADASKERFHDKARGQLQAIDEENARRSGGGGAAPTGGGGYGGRSPVAPADAGGDGDGGGPDPFGNDDDIPFLTSTYIVTERDM